MSRFDIDVTRDGGWWMVHIPELGGRTQARYPREVELKAREYIAVSTGTPIDKVVGTRPRYWDHTVVTQRLRSTESAMTTVVLCCSRPGGR